MSYPPKTNRAVEPIYFGARGAPLFGCLHAPGTATSRRFGVVLCYSVGHEYERCHRAFSLLAARLASEGFPVLRFDYYGCGDSMGESEEARLSRWLGDIVGAIRYLRGRSRLTQISLVGLRFGAAMSMIVGAEREEIDHMVLWDPTVDGRTFLDEMESKQASLKAALNLQPGTGLNWPDDHGYTELLGYGYSNSLLEDIEGLNLLQVRGKPAKRVFLLNSMDERQGEQLKCHLENLGMDLDYRHVPCAPVWKAEPYQGLVPYQSVQAMASWLSEIA